jgi:type IV fimbrial biogenesis protein FimT
MAVIGIFVAIAIPSFADGISRSKLKAAADQMLGQFYAAKAESLKTSQPVYFSVATGAAACYGFQTNRACDCTSTGATQCTMALSALPAGGAVTLSSSTIPGGSGNFEPLRGAALSAGTVTFTNSTGLVIKVGVSTTGRVFSCSPAGATNVSGYPSANC